MSLLLTNAMTENISPAVAICKGLTVLDGKCVAVNSP